MAGGEWGGGGEAARLFPASSDTGEAVPVGTSRLVASARHMSGCGSKAQGCLAGARTGVQHCRRCCGSTHRWSRCLNLCRVPVRVVCVRVCAGEEGRREEEGWWW